MYTHLADEVCAVLLVLLGDNDGILPDAVISLVRLTGLELGDNLKFGFLLLLEILVQSQGVVFFLSLTTRATFSLVGLGSTFRRNSTLLSGSVPGRVSGLAAGGLDLSVGLGSGLSLELGVAFVATPALMNLLVGIAGITD